MACTVLPPMTSAKVGEPLAVFNMRTSLKVTVAVSVSVAFRLFTVASPALAILPVELVRDKLEITGANVSMAMLGLNPAPPLLPAAS